MAWVPGKSQLLSYMTSFASKALPGPDSSVWLQRTEGPGIGLLRYVCLTWRGDFWQVTPFDLFSPYYGHCVHIPSVVFSRYIIKVTWSSCIRLTYWINTEPVCCVCPVCRVFGDEASSYGKASGHKSGEPTSKASCLTWWHWGQNLIHYLPPSLSSEHVHECEECQ